VSCRLVLDRAREDGEAVRSPPPPPRDRRDAGLAAAPLRRARVAALGSVGTPGRCVGEPPRHCASACGCATTSRRRERVPRPRRAGSADRQRDLGADARAAIASRSSVCATMPSVEFSTGTTPSSAPLALDLVEDLGDGVAER
jgi:hypothetical protein